MGKQICYYMGYTDFLRLAQTALDCGCVIFHAQFANEKWIITQGNTVDFVSADHRCGYYFCDPSAGKVEIEQHSFGARFSGRSALYLIEAGFSEPFLPKGSSNGRELIRSRLYVPTAWTDKDGNRTERPEAVTKLYQKLVRTVKQIAPLTEFSHYSVNPVNDGVLIRGKAYISPYCLSLLEHEALRLG